MGSHKRSEPLTFESLPFPGEPDNVCVLECLHDEELIHFFIFKVLQSVQKQNMLQTIVTNDRE